MTLEYFLTWALRILGVLWMFGGFIVVREARMSLFAGDAITKIEAMTAPSDDDKTDPLTEVPSDRPRDLWLLAGGLLTFISGAGLVAASPVVMIPMTALLLHQFVYAWRQHRRVAAAVSVAGRSAEAMTRTARNGAITAVIVWMVAAGIFGPRFWLWMQHWL